VNRPGRRTAPTARPAVWRRVVIASLALWLALAGAWGVAHRMAHAPATAPSHLDAEAHAPAHRHAAAEPAHAHAPLGGHAPGSDECRWLDHLSPGDLASATWQSPDAAQFLTPRVPALLPGGRLPPAPGAFLARAPPGRTATA
jgi:hypothetical protein